jgi:hypothetical protein
VSLWRQADPVLIELLEGIGRMLQQIDATLEEIVRLLEDEHDA